MMFMSVFLRWSICWRVNITIYTAYSNLFPLTDWSMEKYVYIHKSSFSYPEKLNNKKKWNLLKNSHSSCKKRVWPSLVALHKMARVKSCEIQVAASLYY